MSEPPLPGIIGTIRRGSLRRENLVEMASALLPPGVRMAGAAVQLLTTVIIARALGDEGSALFFFWSAILMSCVPVATYGLEQISLRNAPRIEEEGFDRVSRYLASLRSFAFSTSLLFGAGLFIYAALRIEPGESLQYWHFLIPVALASMTINMINGESLKGLSRPVRGMIFGHFIPVSLFCLFTALFAADLTSPRLIAIYTGSYAVAAIVVALGPVPEFRRFFAIPSRSDLRGILREGFPVCCVSLFGAFSYVIPLAILQISSPEEEVAYVTTSFRISILFTVLSAAIHSVFAPQLSRAAQLPNPGRALFEVYRKAILISLGALFVPLLIGIVFPEYVMAVFGDAFREGAETLRILLIGQLAFLCLGPVPHLLLMTGQTGLLAKLGIAKLISTVVFSFLLIPRFGGEGMVLGLSVAFLLEEIAGLLLAIRFLRKRPRGEGGA